VLGSSGSPWFTSDAITVAIEPMGIGANHAEVSMWDVGTVQVRRRRRDAHRRIGGVALFSATASPSASTAFHAFPP